MRKIRIKVDSNNKFVGFLTQENGIQRNSPSTSDAQRNSPSTSGAQRNSPSTFDAQRSFSTSKKSDSETAKRGQKSSLTSASSVEKSSIEKQKEPVFGEKELVETLMHLWALANSYSIDSANLKRDRSKKFSVTKKRKLQDTVCTEDGLKKPRTHKETVEDYRGEILLDSVSDTFTCAFCGKSFNNYQALGGHKSSCKRKPLKNEVIKPAVQESTATSKIHPCKICGKVFLSGCALGEHQKSHKTGEVEPSSSSVSPPPKEKESNLHLIQSSTTSVEEQADVPNKKIIMFDLNEKPPEDGDEN